MTQPQKLLAQLPLTLAGKAWRRFPDYGWAYYNYLLARVESLPLPSPVDPAAPVYQRIQDRIAEIKTREEPRLAWNDLATIEGLLLQIESEASLRREAWNLRERYRRVARPDEYAVYQASNFPDATTAPAEELRTDLVSLASLLYFHYDLLTQGERLRDHLSRWAARWAILVAVIGLALILLDYQLYGGNATRRTVAPLLLYIVMMGALGGFISVQRRVQQSALEKDTLSDVISLEEGRKSTIIGPIQGAIFAIVLYLAFASGALTGTFFPKINSVHVTPAPGASAAPGITFRNFVENTNPIDAENLALVLLWSFLAGFAERLVPDALDRITGGAFGRKAPSASQLPLPDGGPPPAVKTLTVQPDAVSVAAGQDTSLRAVAVNSAGSPVPNPTVQWVSRKPEIATVSPGGLVHGVAEGQTSIDATDAASGKTATCVITVTAAASGGAGNGGPG